MTPNPMLPLIYKMLGHITIVGTAAGGLLATDIDFRSQITLGSLLVGVLVLAVAGIITIRSKIATIWREEAEGERAAKGRLQEELNAQKLAYAEFEKHQQELRNDLKGQNAALSAQLRVFEAKTDLTKALDAIKSIAEAQAAGHQATHKLLVEIRDKLPSEPLETSHPVEITDVGK